MFTYLFSCLPFLLFVNPVFAAGPGTALTVPNKSNSGLMCAIRALFARKSAVLQVLPENTKGFHLFHQVQATSSKQAKPGRAYKIVYNENKAPDVTGILISNADNGLSIHLEKTNLIVKNSDIEGVHPFYYADQNVFDSKAKEIEPGRYYTFTIPSRRQYIFGKLLGYDPENRFVVETESGQKMILDPERLDLNAIRTGRSCPELHDFGISQDMNEMKFTLFKFKDEGIKPTLYQIKGFTPSGDLLVNEAFELDSKKNIGKWINSEPTLSKEAYADLKKADSSPALKIISIEQIEEAAEVSFSETRPTIIGSASDYIGAIDHDTYSLRTKWRKVRSNEKEKTKALAAGSTNPVLYDSSIHFSQASEGPVKGNAEIVITDKAPRVPVSQMKKGYAYSSYSVSISGSPSGPFKSFDTPRGIITNIDHSADFRWTSVIDERRASRRVTDPEFYETAQVDYYVDESCRNIKESSRTGKEVYAPLKKNRFLQTQQYYTFTNTDHSLFFPGKFLGYDPNGNIVLRTDAGAKQVLDVHRLDMRAIRSGKSIPALHDYSMGEPTLWNGGPKSYVVFRFKDGKPSNTIYRIDGFTADGKIIAVPILKADKGVDKLLRGKPSVKLLNDSALNAWINPSSEPYYGELTNNNWYTYKKLDNKPATPIEINPNDIQEFIGVEYSRSHGKFIPKTKIELPSAPQLPSGSK
jgi:hypothetical protein